MIVTSADFPRLSGVVAMVDGGFDPLHAGHVAYFREAHALGAPVLCNVSGDNYVSQKHPPLLPENERSQVLDAIRWLKYVHVSRTSTEVVLESLRPRYYVKGGDWRGRLPSEQVELCARHRIEIVYLDTVTDSSSRRLSDFVQSLREYESFR